MKALANSLKQCGAREPSSPSNRMEEAWFSQRNLGRMRELQKNFPYSHY
jgi:hypothetical protein